MDTKLIIIGLVVLIAIGVGIYLYTTSLETASDNSIPNLPEDEGLSGQVLDIFSNTQDTTQPPTIPTG